MTLSVFALFLLLAVAMLIGGLLGYWLRGGGAAIHARLVAQTRHHNRYRATAEALAAQRDARIAELEQAYTAATGDLAPAGHIATVAAEPGGPEGATIASADAPHVLTEPSPAALSDALPVQIDDDGITLPATVRDTLGDAAGGAAIAAGGATAAAIAGTVHPLEQAPAPLLPAVQPPAPQPSSASGPIEAASPGLAPEAPADPMPDGAVLADDLTRIRGIDEDLAHNLLALGVHQFSDIETMSAIDELALEQRLKLPAGYITAEQWRLQAALLAADVARAQGIAR